MGDTVAGSWKGDVYYTTSGLLHGFLGLQNQPHKTRIPYAGMKTFYVGVLDIGFAILGSEG